MTSSTHLCFQLNVAVEKASYTHERTVCPFCLREELTGIIAAEGPMLLIENKFQLLAEAYQTVLIETDSCTENITTYSPDYMQQVLTFGIDHWLAMEASGAYTSVVFFKNHGPLSGGTIAHAHFQIVGLKRIDYRNGITDAVFEGIEVYRAGRNLINVSTKPNASATEINIIVPERDDAFMADAIQKVVRYLQKRTASYNLFFYQWKGAIICKAMPRYVVSPYLMGYAIPHTSNQLEMIAEEMRGLYGWSGGPAAQDGL